MILLMNISYYIESLFSREYSRHNEKRILARGELISTALLHFLLSETGIPSRPASRP